MSSYEALYRKYRPQTFRDLAGQDPVANTLRNEVRDDRLTHAYLFTGPRGTGKTTTARLLAKALNCVKGPTVDPCGPPAHRDDPPDPTGQHGECPQCRAIRVGSHLDVVEIDAASNRGIEDIRELQERVRLAPVQGRYKVFIIDEVHMLTDPAWNALLKTLEEPPPNCLFVLATTEVHKVLATVLSRCQRFDFQRIGQAALLARLRQVAAAEGLVVDPEALEAIARRAEGGLRDALSLLDQVAAGASLEATGTRHLTAQSVFEALGLISGEAILALGDAVARRDAVAALTGCNELLAAGHDHRAIVRELLTWARNALLLQLAPDQAEALEIPAGQRDRLTAHAGQMSRPDLLHALEILRETDQALRGSSQATIWLEMGLLRLCDRIDIPSLADLAARVAALEARLQAGGEIPRAPSASQSSSSPLAAAPPSSVSSSSTSATHPAIAATEAGPGTGAQGDHAHVQPEISSEGGSFELAQHADQALQPNQRQAALGLAPTDVFEALKQATQSLRRSTKALFDQYVTGAHRRSDGTIVVHARPNPVIKEGRDGFQALQELVWKHFGEGVRLELSHDAPPARSAASASPSSSSSPQAALSPHLAPQAQTAPSPVAAPAPVPSPAAHSHGTPSPAAPSGTIPPASSATPASQEPPPSPSPLDGSQPSTTGLSAAFPPSTGAVPPTAAGPSATLSKGTPRGSVELQATAGSPGADEWHRTTVAAQAAGAPVEAAPLQAAVAIEAAAAPRSAVATQLASAPQSSVAAPHASAPQSAAGAQHASAPQDPGTAATRTVASPLTSSHGDPIALASELLLGKILEG